MTELNQKDYSNYIGRQAKDPVCVCMIDHQPSDAGPGHQIMWLLGKLSCTTDEASLHTWWYNHARSVSLWYITSWAPLHKAVRPLYHLWVTKILPGRQWLPKPRNSCFCATAPAILVLPLNNQKLQLTEGIFIMSYEWRVHSLSHLPVSSVFPLCNLQQPIR